LWVSIYSGHTQTHRKLVLRCVLTSEYGGDGQLASETFITK